jgi:hypothetical protein
LAAGGGFRPGFDGALDVSPCPRDPSLGCIALASTTLASAASQQVLTGEKAFGDWRAESDTAVRRFLLARKTELA